MSAVLRMLSNGQRLHPLSDTLDKYSTPAFISTNKGSSPSSHSLTGSECGKAWERVPSEPGFHPVRSSIDPTTSVKDKPHGISFKRKRAHSTQTTPSCRILGKGYMLTEPSLMASFIEHGTGLERCQRALLIGDTSYADHQSSADLGDCEANQGHSPSTLELPYKTVLIVRESSTSEDAKSTSDNTEANQRVNHIRAVDRRFFSRSRTGCKTCRKRKKKCDEAKPTCRNCIRGNFACAGYTKEISWSRDSPARTLPAPRPQQQMSHTEDPTHIVRCPVCNVTHSSQCGLGQKVCVEPIAASRITTSRDGPVCTDKQGHKPS
jgi:hypothetical protein